VIAVGAESVREMSCCRKVRACERRVAEFRGEDRAL